MKNLNIYLAIACLCATSYSFTTEKHISKKGKGVVSEMVEETPQYLYKIVSVANWDTSQTRDCVVLAPNDDVCIHLSKEDQVEKVVKKKWATTSYVLLKIETSKLPGRLVFETSPGGSIKHYHLYEGSIPLNAIVDHAVVPSSLSSSVSKLEYPSNLN
jgi:uncharacterized protein (DUF952 family)